MIITYNGEPLTTNARTVFDLVMDQFGTEMVWLWRSTAVSCRVPRGWMCR